MAERKLIAVSEEEVERLRWAAGVLWSGPHIYDREFDPADSGPAAESIVSIADRYEDGITEEEGRLILECARLKGERGERIEALSERLKEAEAERDDRIEDQMDTQDHWEAAEARADSLATQLEKAERNTQARAFSLSVVSKSWREAEQREKRLREAIEEHRKAPYGLGEVRRDANLYSALTDNEQGEEG